MGNESKIGTILNEILRVESIEEAFNCIIVHNTSKEKEKIAEWQAELTSAMKTLTTDQQENAIRKFLYTSADITNYRRLNLVLSLLENLVSTGVLPSKLVCDCILNCEKLHYRNEEFWIKCFTIIRHIIGGVDYKKVRDIMKLCREKAHSLPIRLDASVQPQMRVLESLIEYIFDRNACLIPSYLIIAEIQKISDSNHWPHWLSKLVSNFIGSFRSVVQMISIIGHSKMLPVIEHTGYGDHLMVPWLLDRNTLRFTLKGDLPYDSDLLKPQTHLLKYVLEQPYSRDMVNSMLGLHRHNQQSTRCLALEDQLVELVISTMEKTEAEPTSVENFTEVNLNHNIWLHLSSQILSYVTSPIASFPDFLLAVHDKLAGREWKKSRDYLMWVLLQYISGSIQRKTVESFFPFFKLYDLLYPEKDPYPVPDLNNPACSHQMALVSIWIHLLRKTQADHANIQRLIPHNLKLHYELLQHMAVNNVPLSMGTDYKIALLCNAYSTCNELFTRPMATLHESVMGPQKNQQQQPLGLLNNSSQSTGPTAPLPMSTLDSLTVHVKMTLLHSIVTHIAKSASNKSNLPLPPALVETYSRLLVYTEIDSFGFKKFISQLLPTVFKAHAWGILYTLLDMFSYRMHHIQPTYRVQILSHLHSLASVPQTNQTQLHLCVESTALRLITGLVSSEVQLHLSRFLSEPKTLISADSEELNRALVLTLARSMHITGTGKDSVGNLWCKDLLNTIMLHTPHLWADHTLQCFPPVLSEYFRQNSVSKEEKHQIKKAVEEEYRNWVSMSNENDIIAHFSVPNSPPLFLCLLWKMILETDRINPIVYKILERIGARALSAHLRIFCDYIVFEVTSLNCDASYVSKSVDAINGMIWKYNIVTFDRLVLCLSLRTLEGHNEAEVCFYIVQLLLLKANEFRSRVQEFVKENSPDHWKQSNWHEKHLAFQRKFPEKFAPEGMMEPSSGGPNQYNSFPAYFGNVCLRFLPVFDIVLHRYLEIPQVTKSLEVLLEHLGCLYRFHDRPVTYLYNTLHYYEKNLRDKLTLKRRLVMAILGSLRELRASGWALSDDYWAFPEKYMTRQSNEWQPNLDYYIRLVQRLVDTMSGRAQLPPTDWRFNEFPNPTAHILYVTCVELMALPVLPNVVANNLLDVVAKGYTVTPSDEIHMWINCIGLIMTALPECYWLTLHDRLIETVTSPSLTDWKYDNLSPFQLFNFKLTHNSFLENKYSYMLALAHSVWHHAGVGQLAAMVQFIREKLQPLVKNEEQLIFVCHLIGPTLTRFEMEKIHCLPSLTIILYEMLEQVDQSQSYLKHMDPVCDLMYHIKYMYMGDNMKNEIDSIIRRLRPALQMRLRFITHLNIDEIKAS